MQIAGLTRGRRKEIDPTAGARMDTTAAGDEELE